MLKVRDIYNDKFGDLWLSLQFGRFNFELFERIPEIYLASFDVMWDSLSPFKDGDFLAPFIVKPSAVVTMVNEVWDTAEFDLDRPYSF